LFDKCLAPNTMGDGTGCDNMTAIIVQFKPTFTENGNGDSAQAPTRKRTVSVDNSPTTNGEKGDDEAKRVKLDTTEKPTVVEAAAATATETPETAPESGISSSS
jgi:protein phosphatase 1G